MAEFVSVNRILQLPVISTSWNYAGNAYCRIKVSNSALNWTCQQAEASLTVLIKTAIPPIRSPLHRLDRLVCKGLDAVEGNIKNVHAESEKVYRGTKQYLDSLGERLAKPILKRADSVKQLGSTVLESKYTTFAANKLDGALNVAEKYVDRFLPEDTVDGNVEERSASVSTHSGKAYQTIHHMDQFSRKLQRRLTQRTIAEAKALKKRGVEATHILVYVTELIAYDPKLAYVKAKELWAYLSINEPENQARPTTLEEAGVLLTREFARRVVHFINFSTQTVGELQSQLKIITYNFLHRVESVLKEKVARSLEQHKESIKSTNSASQPNLLSFNDLHPSIRISQLRASRIFSTAFNGASHVNG